MVAARAADPLDGGIFRQAQAAADVSRALPGALPRPHLGLPVVRPGRDGAYPQLAHAHRFRSSPYQSHDSDARARDPRLSAALETRRGKAETTKIMADLLDQIIALAEKGNVEQRSAALLVMGALKLDNARVLKAVGAALENSNPIVQDYALRCLEATQAKAAIPLLMALLDRPDKDLQDRAVRLLIQMDGAAVEPLLKLAPSAPRPAQLNAARVLAAVGGKTAIKGTLRMLEAGTDEFNKAVCDLLTPALRDFTEKEQEWLYGEMETLAGRLDAKEKRPALVSAFRLFGQLGFPQARKRLFGFAGREHHPALRGHALGALIRCLREEDLRKDEYAK